MNSKLTRALLAGGAAASLLLTASTAARGRTVGPNLRITDRGIDRSFGVWKFASKFNVGISSTNDTVYFAWQDTRNAVRDSSAEDVYTASLALAAKTETSDSGGPGVPGWLLVGAGVAVGMGLTMVAVWRVRRSQSEDALR